MSVMSAIRTDKLTKRFGELTAVDSLDLTVKEGECYGLIGPNGSGKTTIIKMLTGLARPSSGSARVMGKEIPNKALMREIGYMPQETAVYIDNTVGENLRFFGQINGMVREKIEERMEELLDFVDLADRRNSMVGTLSGGMKHRLSLACAMIHEPRMLFLDEPTVGVDPELRENFWNYFGIMVKKGITVVITTHYMDEACHCSRVGLMREGKLIADGSPGELLERTNTGSLEDAFLELARRGGR